MNSIRLGFNNVVPAPKDRVVLTPDGFVKYFEKEFVRCDMYGKPVLIPSEFGGTKAVEMDVKEWVDFF